MAHGVAKSRAWLVVAFAVAKCRCAANRRKQNWRIAHGMQNLCAFAVARRAHSDEMLHGHRWCRRRIFCGLQIILKNWTEQMLTVSNLCGKKLADHGAEEKPPEIEHPLQIVQPKWFQNEALVGEELRRLAYCQLRFRSDSAERVTFQNSNADFRRTHCRGIRNWDWGGKRIVGIRPTQYFEQDLQIANGARHRPDGSEPSERAVSGRIVAAGRNSPWRRLQSTDTAKMCGHADRAAAVAAHSARGTAGSNRSGFTAAGTSRRELVIPRIAGFSGEPVIGFVSHQKFRSVGVTQENCSSVAKPLHQDRVAGWTIFFS